MPPSKEANTSNRGSGRDYEHANIDELMVEWRSDIDQLKVMVQDVAPDQTDKYPYFDDLWFLRYVLSFGGANISSANAVRKTIGNTHHALTLRSPSSTQPTALLPLH
jgi:hypothetical protein